MNSTVAEIKDGPFGLTVTSIGSTRTVTTNGELDLATVKTLADVLDEIYGEGAETIVLDLGALEFIDSTGLALLVTSHKRFNLDGGRRLRLLPAQSDGVRRIFTLTGLDEGLPFADEVTLEVPDSLELEAS
jgi:anti-sigma B factor antagonist